MRRCLSLRVFVAGALIIAWCLLLPWALQGDVGAATALTLLWMGLLGQHWFLDVSGWTRVKCGLNFEGPEIILSIAEGALALSLVLFQQSLPPADRSRVLLWLVGLFCVEVFIYHGINYFIQSGLRYAHRPLPPDAPSIHYRWLADESNWWIMQEVKLIGFTLVLDGVKMVLLVVYLVGLVPQF